MADRCETRKTILEWLDHHQICYQFYEHLQADTIADCVQMPFIDEHITICKNVFLSNRQQTRFYLMLLRPDTPFRTAVVSKSLGVSRLSFAPDAALQALLHLSPGSVSPLGLYFDAEHQVQLVYEKAIKDTPRIAFHPCDNTATVIFDQDEFWNKVLPLLGVVPVCVADAIVLEE